MVNETIINQIDLNKGADFFTYLSKTLTEIIVNQLSKWGFDVSVRWAGLMVGFLSLFMIFLAFRLSKPILRFALFILGAILIVGLIIPSAW